MLLAALLTLGYGCGSGRSDQPAGPADGIRVGAFNFVESEILAEIYAQALEQRGFPVQRLGPIGSREVVQPALELGHIDVVPEYAGTMLSFVTLGANEPTSDTGRTVAELRSALVGRGMTALAAAPAQNRNTLVVSRTFAARHRVRQVSDLTPLAAELVFGGPSECAERYFCLVGLREVYGLEFGSFIPTPNARVVAASLRAGEIDVGLLFSTDPVMTDRDLVVLRDDRGLQPAENVVPVVRRAALERWGPSVIETLDAVSSELGTTDLVRLNAAAGDSTVAAVAAEWLSGS